MKKIEKTREKRIRKLERRFEQWRRNRKHREKIPEELWREAAKVAETGRASQISTRLRVNYSDLKKRMGGSVPAKIPGFVELPQRIRPVMQEESNVDEMGVELPNGVKVLYRSRKDLSGVILSWIEKTAGGRR